MRINNSRSFYIHLLESLLAPPARAKVVPKSLPVGDPYLCEDGIVQERLEVKHPVKAFFPWEKKVFFFFFFFLRSNETR